MRIRRALGALAAVAACVLLASCGGGQDEGVHVLKFASANLPSSPIHSTHLFLAEQLARRTGGKVTLRVYDSGRLGGEREYVEALQLGTIHMTEVTSAVLGSFDSRFYLFDLPFLFRDEAHEQKVLDGPVGRELLDGLSKIGVKGLVFYTLGSRNLYTRKPVRSLDELRGRKIRVMESQLMKDTFDALGANATPLPATELFSALAQGVVDGAENNPLLFLTARHYELCKHYTLTRHFTTPSVLLISQKTFEGLAPELQKVVLEVAAESGPYHREVWGDALTKAVEEIKSKGVTVQAIDTEPFRARVQPIYTQYEARIGADLVKRVLATK